MESISNTCKADVLTEARGKGGSDGMDEITNRDSQQTASALPDLLGKLMSDPGLLQKMGEIVKTASAEPPPEKKEDPLAESGSLPSMQDGLSALLANPAILEKLPSMIATLRPMLAPPPSPQKPSGEKGPASHRDALLLALKPFLSEGRREAVDSILRIARLTEILRQMPQGTKGVD